MNSAEITAGGNRKPVTNDELLAKIQLAASENQTPFSKQLKAVVKSISSKLLAAPFARTAPQVMALGYWLRPAAITRLQQHFEQTNTHDAIPVARGLAFQLPPENVDTLFVYSWVLSFLLGNSNVTRLPSTPNAVANWLVEIITTVLAEHKQSERQLFCYFDKNSNIGTRISKLADLRVIWGGNEKIESISRDLIKPDGLSIGFSDRKSICVIQTHSYQQLDETEQLSLAEKFYNDTYWFDQMGCGSPRLLIWIGKDAPPIDCFFEHLNQIIEKKNYQLEAGVAIDKLVFANEMLIDDISSKIHRYRAEFMLLECALDPNVLDHVKGGGTLFCTQASTLCDIAALARPDLQTISTFGFSQQDKIDLAIKLNGKGGYRIVPIGDALNFDSVWDGLDIMHHFSRQIRITG